MKNLIVILFGALSILLGGAILSTTGLNPIIAVTLAGLFAFATSFWNVKGLSFLNICGQLGKNIEKLCLTPLQSGTRDRAWLINFEHIEAATISYAADGYTITNIVLPTGKKAQFIDGKNNSIRPMQNLAVLPYDNMFDHSISFLCFDISPEMKNEFNLGRNGKYVVITENFHKGAAGISAFEIYGLSTGLDFTALSRDPNSADNSGAYDFTLSTTNNKEPKLPNPFHFTSYSATKLRVVALL